MVSERTKDKTPSTCDFKTVRDRRVAEITRRVVSGGYTVRHYSKSINCVQIELANTMRDTDAAVDRTVDALSWALLNFVRRHASF